MCIKCGDKYHISLSLSSGEDRGEALEPELKRIAKLIHSGKMKAGDVDAKMISKVAKQLMQGVFHGFGKSFDDALSIEDFTMLKVLEKNIFVFSGFKNYQQLKECSLLLNDGNSGLKPFNQFLKDVRAVDSTYSGIYLNAEYGNAAASSQAIAFWQESERNKEHVKNLVLRTAGDTRVRPAHAMLDGVTRAKDDPFWDTHFIPLDWGCRCDIEETNDEVTDIPEILPKVPPMFQTNVGKTGIIFPDTHPYFDAPKETAGKIIKQAEKIQAADDLLPEGMAEYEKDMNVKIDRTFLSMLNKPTRLRRDGTTGAYYIPGKNIVNIPKLERYKNFPERIIYHEYGHAIDWQNNLKEAPEVSSLMDQYKKKYRKGKFSELDSLIQKDARSAALSGDKKLQENILSFADTIMSLNPNYGYGHTKSYFKRAGMKEAEFIAHVFENRFAGNDYFKKVAPDLFDDMVRLADVFFQRTQHQKR